MNPEHERWAEALLIERQHGERAPDIIADRVKTLAEAGDEAGVLRWIDIATRYDQLRGPSRRAALTVAGSLKSAGRPPT